MLHFYVQLSELTMILSLFPSSHPGSISGILFVKLLLLDDQLLPLTCLFPVGMMGLSVFLMLCIGIIFNNDIQKDFKRSAAPYESSKFLCGPVSAGEVKTIHH